MKEHLLRFEESLPTRIQSWVDRNPKHARIIPRMIIFMFIATLGSGLIYEELDFMVYVISITILFFVIFFLSFDKFSPN